MALPVIQRRAARWLQAATIILAAAWVYAPAFNGSWLWDDDIDITGNRLLREPGALAKIWFTPPGPDYYPLKTTAQWCQWRLWGEHPLGYHLTNVALHILGALLFWRLLRQVGVRLAWVGGLLFAVHPLAVESVAWIVELKNTLSLPLFLGALGAYLDWDADRRPGGRGRPRTYLLSLVLFLAAILAKSSAVMLPVVLLLHAWWRRGRIARTDLAASAGFFAISAASGAVAIWMQRHYSIGAEVIRVGGVLPRIALAGLAAAFYLAKSIFPFGLSAIYPRWTIDPPTAVQFLPWLVFAILAFWFWSRRAGWGRHALFGLGFFIANLLPVIGFVTISHMRFTWVMDHLAYLPLLGIVGLGAAGLDAWHRRTRPWVPVLACALVCGLFAWQGRTRAAVFRDQESLWTDTLRHDPDAWLAQNNLGIELLKKGRTAEAVARLREAVRLHPDTPEAENYLGFALAQGGRLDEALPHYEKAILLKGAYGDAHDNLGLALWALGRTPEALAQFDEALRINQDDPNAHNDRGCALAGAGRLPEAVSDFEAALRTNPDNPQAHSNLASVLARMGRLTEAIGHFKRAQQLKPDYADSYSNLGVALADAGRTAEAIAAYEAALRIRPDLPVVHYNLANALAADGRKAEAAQHYETALRLKPDFARARESLERLRAGPGR